MQTLRQPTFACLIGPTAAGKSEIALALAEVCGAEIVSLDSMQVYRGMDIGTAKPGPEERARVRHHMLDLVEPDVRYDVRRYLADVAPVLDDIASRGARALVVGGTALYLKALIAGLFDAPPIDWKLRSAIEARARADGNARLHEELARVDPTSAARIHVNDTKRLVRALEVFEQTGQALSDWQTQWRGAAVSADRAGPVRITGLEVDVSDLDVRIAERTRAMILAGWPAEAVAIRARSGFGPSAVQALGYREVLELADGRLDMDSCTREIALRTRQFARRQRTWYRKFAGVSWFPALDRSQDDPAARTRLVREIASALGWG